MEFDAASHTKVDEIREIILESINVNPVRDRYKVFIIDEVHMLSTSSFNALLKTLEEPPPKVVFIMATTELHKIPDTILSRCQQFDFRTIALQKILVRLKEIAEAEEIDISDSALKEIARSGEGSMRDAQSNFDQVISFSGAKIETADVISALGIASTEHLTKTILSISNRDSSTALTVVEDLVERGQDLRNFCRDLLAFVRDLLIVKIAGDPEPLLESAILSVDELKTHSSPFLETDLIRFFNSIAETEAKIRDATEPRYLLEIGLIKLIEMRRITPVEQLIERLTKLEKSISVSSATTDTNLISGAQGSSSSSPVAQEKKTLASDFRSNDLQFSIKSDQAYGEMKEQAEDLDNSDKANEIVPDFANSVERNKKPTAESIKTHFELDINSMPVKLEPISSEDLEHVEDKKLDAEFEHRLQKEGDNLQTLQKPHELVEIFLGSKESGVSRDSGTSFEMSQSAAVQPASYRQNKALEIVSQITETEEIDNSIPILPENIDDKDMLYKYAKKHPQVRKVMRVFRGKLVDVKKE